MACQTGIRADENLLNFFEQCKQCKIRFGKIVINKEKLSVNYHSGPTSDWKADWRKHLPDLIDAYEPCFILFRFDSNHDWILISFSDDKASVRDKMLLAATKATFKSEFGQSFIRAEYQVTNRADLLLENFEKRYLTPFSNTTTTTFESSGAIVDDSKPFTHIERELSTVIHHQFSTQPFALQSAQTLRGIQFPIDQDAIQLLKNFAKFELDFVQLSVDTLNEAIKLENSKPELAVEDLSANISRSKPRYSLFRYRDHEKQPVFFIYSVPPSASCTIKELMLFSSCKAPFLSEIQDVCGIQITKKIEVDSREKLDSATLLSYISPIMEPSKAQFERRPQCPGSGPRRITQQQVVAD